MLTQTQITPGRAALIAGLAILVMAVTVPTVEFYIFPKLVNYNRAEETAQNIAANRILFSTAIFVHFSTVICDLIAGWALYIFLRPVNKDIALLSALFRTANAAFTITALANLVQVTSLLNTASTMAAVPDSEEIMFRLQSFNLQWRFMLVFFGIYMIILAYLVWHAPYIPTFMAACLAISGIGYIIDDLKFFFYPQVNTGFLWFTYFGELIFMFWLLFKGRKGKYLESRSRG